MTFSLRKGFFLKFPFSPKFYLIIISFDALSFLDFDILNNYEKKDIENFQSIFKVYLREIYGLYPITILDIYLKF